MSLLQYSFDNFEAKFETKSANFGVPKAINENNRGASGHLIALILAHADIETPLVGGHVGLRVSRQLAQQNDMRAVFGANSDIISDYTIVWSDFTSSVITVLSSAPRASAARLN